MTFGNSINLLGTSSREDESISGKEDCVSVVLTPNMD